MKFLPFFTLFFAIFGILQQIHADNLLKDPGFELENSAWRRFIPGSDYFQNSPETKVDASCLDGSDPHSGSVAAVMESDSKRWALTASNIRLDGGLKYRVEAWLKYAPGSTVQMNMPGAYVGVAFYSYDWEELCTQPPYTRTFFGLPEGVVDWQGRKLLFPENPPEKWTKVSAVFQAPPDSAYLNVGLCVHGLEGKVFWDDVSVEEVDSSTPVTAELK